MIAKGTPHTSGARLARYLVTGKDGERAELHELRGFAEADIADAFRSIHVMAQATQCEQPFFHCQVRNPQGETLTRQQWEAVADRIEQKLGLDEQPRAIAFHSKDGHEHMHIAWSRIEAETLTAIPLPFYKLRLKEACRELERELGLTRVRDAREPHEPKAPSRGERDQANRLGIDVDAVRGQIRDAWERSDTGRAFAMALSDEGLTLARGDRRDYVVIDQEGGLHALGKRLLGVSAAEARDRLRDLRAELLPSVEETRARLELEREGDEHVRRSRAANDNAGMAAQQAEANRRHLDLNPSLKVSPEDRQRLLEQQGKEIAADWQRHQADRDIGRDR